MNANKVQIGVSNLILADIYSVWFRVNDQSALRTLTITVILHCNTEHSQTAIFSTNKSCVVGIGSVQ
jgi:hypothetical protein